MSAATLARELAEAVVHHTCRAMQRTLRLVAAVTVCFALAGCHEGSGWAERVDVPLGVTIEMTSDPRPHCGPDNCFIGYRVVITDRGDRPVYARDCVARGLDRYGHPVVETTFGFGIGPGAGTEPGMPYRSRGTMLVKSTPEELADVRSLEGSCLAYVWHGTTPI